MNWHERYMQQAGWTHDLRVYLFDQARLADCRRMLEVGCGTGAVLSSLNTPAALYGLDISCEALKAAKIHTQRTGLICGDAVHLPYPAGTFDITYCHFLLLWVKEPGLALVEMKRVTRPGGFVLALAEPDYTARRDQPQELVAIGKLQTESLRRQGADVGLGSRLADLFYKAGITIRETGALRDRSGVAARDEQEQEWAILESDLALVSPPVEIQRMKLLDHQAWSRGQRRMFVPTYFVWGQV